MLVAAPQIEYTTQPLGTLKFHVIPFPKLDTLPKCCIPSPNIGYHTHPYIDNSYSSIFCRINLTSTKHQLNVDVFVAVQSALPLDLLVFIGRKTMVRRVFYPHDWLTDGPQTLPFEDQEICPPPLLPSSGGSYYQLLKSKVLEISRGKY